MSQQLDFGIGTPTIQQRFEDFHRDNPTIYGFLVGYARAANANGKRVGIRAIWERMRWHVFIDTRGNEDFKLNDHFTSRYARMIEEREADLKGFFELRGLRAE